MLLVICFSCSAFACDSINDKIVAAHSKMISKDYQGAIQAYEAILDSEKQMNSHQIIEVKGRLFELLYINEQPEKSLLYFSQLLHLLELDNKYLQLRVRLINRVCTENLKYKKVFNQYCDRKSYNKPLKQDK
jgi:hypothetical protein